MSTDTITIDTWEQVDNRLAELRKLEAEIDTAAAEFDLRILAIEEAKAEALKDTLERKVAIAAAVLSFVQEHGADLPEGERSVKLPNGQVGFRKSPDRVVYDRGESYALEVLKLLRKSRCIAKVEGLVAAEVKKLDAGSLAAAAIRVVADETVFYKLPEPRQPKAAKAAK